MPPILRVDTTGVLSASHAILNMSGQTHIDKVLGYSPIAYWPLNETANVVAACLVNAAHNGTYVGTTLAYGVSPHGLSCPLFDGINDYVDVYSAALANVFNPSEGSWCIWAKVFNVGVWTDGNTRRAASFGEALGGGDASYVLIGNDENNLIRWQYVAGGTTETIDEGGHADIDWMHWAITWSVLADEVKAYFNGRLVATAGMLGAWVGDLANDATVLGDVSTSNFSPWHGLLSDAVLFDRPLPAGQIISLARR